MTGDKILLATGNQGLDAELHEAMTGKGISFAGDPVYYREALELADVVKDAGVVVLSTALGGSTPFEKVVHAIRSRDLRVVLLVGKGEDKIKDAAIGMGVYDIIDDPVMVADVVRYVLYPATYASVKGEGKAIPFAEADGTHVHPTGRPDIQPEDVKEKGSGVGSRSFNRKNLKAAIGKWRGDAGRGDSPNLTGLKIWANFPLKGANTFTTVPGGIGDAVIIKAGRGAVELVKKLRRDKAWLTVPIIVMGSSDAVYLDAGADDCISEFTVQTVQKIRQLGKRMKDLWAQSEVDGLTGCYTRRFLDSYLSGECRLFSVLMCDLDHFKAINDTYGHSAGDEVLRRFGEFLRENVRQTDIVARYGGEEFVVIFALSDNGITRAEALCKAWADRRIRLPDGQIIESTFSGGFAAGSGVIATLIHAADQALYRAKQAGRNRVIVTGKEGDPGEIVDRTAAIIGEFTVVAFLERDSAHGFKVMDARGPFAGQLIGEVVDLVAGDGINAYSGNHWLFGLSGETLLSKQGKKAILVGKRVRFSKSEIKILAKYVKGVL